MNKIPCLLLFPFLGTFTLSAQQSPPPPPRLVEPPRAIAPPPPIRLVEPPRDKVDRGDRGAQANPAEVEARKKKLRQSFQTWQKIKQECGGDYSYKKHWSSWVGFGHVTTVVVQDNKVVERSFRSFSGKPILVAPGQAPKPDGKTWTERGPDVGKHKEGHPAKTLDELYAEAKAIVHGPVPPFNRMSLRTDKNGLLLACYLQDTRIADDAPTKGVNVTSITLGKKNAPAPIKPKPIRPIFKPGARKPYPKHWGDPPRRQTRDLRPLPGGYGMGSGTLAKWIQKNLERDKKAGSTGD